jgi:Zn-finger protein
MAKSKWRCVWIKDNGIWGTKNICYYCGQSADSVDHVIPQAMLRQLAALSDVQITKEILRKRALKVWACRECNCLASDSIQDSLIERRQFVKEKLRKRYRKILELPKWEESELNELGYVLRQHIELYARIKEWVKLRIAF